MSPTTVCAAEDRALTSIRKQSEKKATSYEGPSTIPPMEKLRVKGGGEHHTLILRTNPLRKELLKPQGGNPTLSIAKKEKDFAMQSPSHSSNIPCCKKTDSHRIAVAEEKEKSRISRTVAPRKKKGGNRDLTPIKKARRLFPIAGTSPKKW